MKIILAGTGTSHGIPVIGCSCPVCRSGDSADKRMRTAAFIEGSDGTSAVIDIGPEFRIQALQWNLQKLDILLLTHSHADHVHGLDDVRIFSHTWKEKNGKLEPQALKLYSNEQSLADVRERFNYIFKQTQRGGGKPRLKLEKAEPYTEASPLILGSLKIVHVPLKHGSLNSSGWKITDQNTDESFAYLTDCSSISDESIDLLKGLKHLVIDGLREEPHSTHLSFGQSLGYAKKIKAAFTWITHICHDFSNQEIIRLLAEKQDAFPLKERIRIAPAYDGLMLDC